MAKPCARFLFIDAYDSYSNNIVALLELSIHCRVTVVKIDDPDLQDPKTFALFLNTFDGVIAGPGPGSPLNRSDVGLINLLWHQHPHPKPVLGICLGHQSLAINFGATLRRLPTPKHGLVTEIIHSGTSIFTGVGNVKATTYNSLHVLLGPKNVVSDFPQFEPTASCPALEPLAWTLNDLHNGSICMALRHTSKPFWSVQYHPESICTNTEGARVIQNWWFEAQKWEWEHGMGPLTPTSLSITPPPLSPIRESPRKLLTSCIRKVYWHAMPLGDLGTGVLIDLLIPPDSDAIAFTSSTKQNGMPVNTETGRFSIIGCSDLSTTDRFEYDENNQTLMRKRGQSVLSNDSCTIKIMWNFLKNFIETNQAIDGPEAVPFWGGLMGLASYEACLATINVRRAQQTPHPGICFAFVERSVVVDHVAGQIYVQSISSNDSCWLEDTTNSILRLQKKGPSIEDFPIPCAIRTLNLGKTSDVPLGGPSALEYQSRVSKCQEFIRMGESYELCLTDSTTVPTTAKAPGFESDRGLFSKLQRTNPAPFSAYLKMQCGTDALTVLSSSPERFVKWNRTGKCQFRPIKGTVRKGPHMTRKVAESILKSSKEQAENIMIVDLIRHDLHAVVDSDQVKVTKLMCVEEYETVYQLVSVVEGQLSVEKDKTGIDILAASLPPGSMTGAPKKRSCEILQHIEDKPRGIYSGVIGYLDVGGGGDFSVVIRTAYSWGPSSENTSPDDKNWTIGAGGAVTIQSTTVGEWEEMNAKRDALLKVFTGG